MDISSSTIKRHDGKLLNQTGPNANRQPFVDPRTYPTIRSNCLPPVCKVIRHNINKKVVLSKALKVDCRRLVCKFLSNSKLVIIKSHNVYKFPCKGLIYIWFRRLALTICCSNIFLNGGIEYLILRCFTSNIDHKR